MARPIDDIADALRDAIIAALKDRQDELTAIAEAGGDKAGHGIFGDVKTLTGILSDIITAVPIVGELLGLPLAPLEAVEGAAGGAGRSFGLGYFLGYAGWQFAQPALRTYTQDMERAFHSLPLDPQVAAVLAAHGLYSESEARSEAEASGLDGHKSDLLIDDARTRPDVATLLEMRRRRLIPPDWIQTALDRHGYPPEWKDAIEQLGRVLLSPADLALANLRGFMTYEQAQQYAALLGVIEPDFQTLIDNTGEPPGAEMLMEALRRRFIDRAQFEHGIRESRVRDEWIDTMLALRYSPMSTADAVRGVVENYLTDEQGAAIADQNGLLPEHWRPLVESWGRPLSHEQMLVLYHRGQATLDDVKQAMRESDLKNKYIDAAIELGRTLIPERTIVSMVNHDVVTGTEAKDLLLIHGYTAEDADRLIALGAAQRTTSHKTLSRTDIVNMYADALLNRAQAADHLSKLGYSAEDAGAMLDLADYKRKASTLKVIERGIQASLKAHHLTQQEALNQLQSAGLDHAQAQTLVDEWLQERRTVTRTLTQSEVVKAIGENIITVQDGRTRLQAMGYADVDINVIFALHGISG